MTGCVIRTLSLKPGANLLAVVHPISTCLYVEMALNDKLSLNNWRVSESSESLCMLCVLFEQTLDRVGTNGEAVPKEDDPVTDHSENTSKKYNYITATPISLPGQCSYIFFYITYSAIFWAKYRNQMWKHTSH